jgi:hypothetical protein
MSWFRSSLHGMSISDWFTAGPAVAQAPAHGLENVREAMLDALGDAGGSRRATLQLRIRNAPDVHTLWALRPEVMDAVSHLHGESEGRQRLARATATFEGLLPAAALTSARGRHRMAQASP